MEDKMRTESAINTGISVLVQDRDVTLVNNNTNIVDSNESSSNLYKRGNIRRLSADNCYLRSGSANDDQTFRTVIQTSENSNNCVLSGHQNKSQLKFSTERRSSVGSNGCLYLNMANHSILQEVELVKKLNDSGFTNTKDANSNLTYNCLTNPTQRRGSLESNITRDVIQHLSESRHQEHNNYVNDDSLKTQCQNMSFPVLKSAPNRLQDHEDNNNCATSNIFDTELQMEQDVGPISDESNHTSISGANSPKVHQEDAHLPDYIQALTEGRAVCGDSYVEFSKPYWLDEEKFQRGQRFARDHLFGIMFSDLISLMLLFAFQSGLEPLIFTGQSDTPFKAFRRYLSTNVRVSTWYDGDVWDTNSEAHKNLKTVRAMHETTRRKMISGKREEVTKKSTLEDPKGSQPMWTDLHEEVREDFQRSCPVLGSAFSRSDEVFISQGGMAMTQFGFLGLVLVYPKWFGIFKATDEDMDGFIHFWRTIAHLLGVEDRFNLCTGDVPTVRQRCLDIIDYLVKPELTRVSRDWMHMSRVMVQGVSFYVMGVSFEVLLLYLCNVLNIKPDKLSSALTFKQRLQYINICFVFWFAMRLSIVWDLLNHLVRVAIKTTLNMKPERLEKIKQRVYPYESEAIATR